MAQERIMAESAPISGTVAAPEGSQQVLSGEVKSPIPGMPQDVFGTLNRYHSRDVIEKQRALHKTHEGFLESARQEAERIKLTQAQQDVNQTPPEQSGSTNNLNKLPLSPGQIVNGKVVEETVLRNAGLGDEERARAAAELLYGKDAKLTEQKKHELLEAHQEASTEKGLNEEYLAGVYNLKPEQIRRKVAKLSSFTPEERRKLFEAGLLGNGDITPEALAQAIGAVLGPILETVRQEAEHPEVSRRVERSRIRDTDFKKLIGEIQDLEKQPRSDERDRLLIEKRAERDQKRREVNEALGFNPSKEELFDLYYDSRVKIDRDQKHGTLEWKRRTGMQKGRLETLKDFEHEAIKYSWEGNYLDEETGTRGFWQSAYGREVVQKLIAYWQSKGTNYTEDQIVNIYGGIVDDFQEESVKMIRAVVVNRHMFDRDGLDETRKKYRLISDDQYRTNGLTATDDDGNGIWNFEWASDHNRKYFLRNFDDVRDLVEHERRKKYFIPNYGDYESYIKLVADDVEEVEECIPYVLSVLKSKFGVGDPNKINEEIEQETRRLFKALEKFQMDLGYEREQPEYRAFRMLLSKINHNIILLQTYEFSDLAYEDWQPYLQSGAKLGRGFHDTEYQDSLPDTILLDRDGLMMLALAEFEKNDGEYWRYGSNSADTPLHLREGDARQWQESRKEEMKESLMKKRLRSMDDLLGLSLDKSRNIIGYGEPKHPAFQQLKAKFDAMDEEDSQKGKPLVDCYGKAMTRWQEYCEKAMAWQDNTTITEIMDRKDKNGRPIVRRVFPIGDVRDHKQRVLFQHPLARSLSEEEFNQMYESVDLDDPAFVSKLSKVELSKIKRGLLDKERKINSIIGTVDSPGSAERVARAFQEDAAAGLARHLVSFDQMRAIGLIPKDTPQNYSINPDGWPVDAYGNIIPREVLHYALNLDGKPIIKDGKLVPEAVPHQVLLRHLCRLAMDYDKKDIKGTDDAADKVKQRRMWFKLSYVIDKMGIGRTRPLFSNWYLGAHDTMRPNWLADIEKHLPGFAELMKIKGIVRGFNSDDEFGGDEKTVLTREVENERELVELMEMYIRDQFPTYFNYPGHDTRGGGNKEGRNLLLLPLGQSRGTVEMNGMIPHIWLGETDFLSAYGCSNWREFIGLYKLSDEVTYKQQGSLFETPRDAQYWFRRIGAIIEQQKLWISDSDKHKAILNSGWGSGFFKWRALNRVASFLNVTKTMPEKFEGTNVKVNIFTTIHDSDEAYKYLDQKTYEQYVTLAFQFLGPIMQVFEARQKLENVYGKSPGTAKFLNTLTWYALSRWMDTNWEEFRGKHGNALDVNLHMARKFMRTALYEAGYIFYDDQMDQRILGYTIPRKVWDKISSAKSWNEMTEAEQKEFKISLLELTDGEVKIPKVTRYKTNKAGETIAYEKDDDGRIVFKGHIEEGETIPGLIDAFPSEIQKVILERHNQTDKAWIIPMGLNTEYPETLGVIKELKKRGEHEGMRGIYEKILEPLRFKKETRQRVPVQRAA